MSERFPPELLLPGEYQTHPMNAVASGSADIYAGNVCLGTAAKRRILGLWYQTDGAFTGTATALTVGIRRQGVTQANAISSPSTNMAVRFLDAVTAITAGAVQEVDLTTFTDAQRTLNAGDDLCAVIKRTSGAWTIPGLQVWAVLAPIPVA